MRQTQWLELVDALDTFGIARPIPNLQGPVLKDGLLQTLEVFGVVLARLQYRKPGAGSNAFAEVELAPGTILHH
ncbi:hypothetical protein D3C78_1930360 [compost metagenome]